MENSVKIMEREMAYRAVTWNEPIIYQLSRPGRRGSMTPRPDKKVEATVGNVSSMIPEEVRRKRLPNLPELSEPEVVRHYIRLSQQTYGVDSGISVGVGTCTMKYSPKVNEALVRSPKLADIHPLQNEETVQGALEIMYRLGKWLCEISGMDEFSLQPRAGAHAVLTNARIIRKYHELKGEHDQRNEIITTVLSHPCNGAAPAGGRFQGNHIIPRRNRHTQHRGFESRRFEAHCRPYDHRSLRHGHIRQELG